MSISTSLHHVKTGRVGYSLVSRVGSGSESGRSGRDKKKNGPVDNSASGELDSHLIRH